MTQSLSYPNLNLFKFDFQIPEFIQILFLFPSFLPGQIPPLPLFFCGPAHSPLPFFLPALGLLPPSLFPSALGPLARKPARPAAPFFLLASPFHPTDGDRRTDAGALLAHARALRLNSSCRGRLRQLPARAPPHTPTPLNLAPPLQWRRCRTPPLPRCFHTRHTTPHASPSHQSQARVAELAQQATSRVPVLPAKTTAAINAEPSSPPMPRPHGHLLLHPTIKMGAHPFSDHHRASLSLPRAFLRPNFSFPPFFLCSGHRDREPPVSTIGPPLPFCSMLMLCPSPCAR